VRGNFFRQVALVAIPAGTIAGAASLIGYELARIHGGLSIKEQQTTAVLILAAVSLLVVIRTARPFVLWKGVLVAVMGAALFTVIVTPVGRNYFELRLPPAEMMWIVAALIAAAGVLLVATAALLQRFEPT
jgi:cation-transporting ATPase E